MMWLTWRQFRAHALVAGVTLALLAAYLVWLGLRIRHSYEINVECGVGCSVETARGILERSYSTSLQVAGLMVILAPALIGAFWGAPLIAREFETGTHRFIWSQSITRTRWLAVKLLFTTLVGVAVTGALSVMLTWAASPYDALIDQRFQPLFFPTRNVAPLGYAAFAVVAGTAIGLLARRTVLAMAITLAAFALLQIVVPTVIRPHLQPVVTESVTLDPTASFDALGVGPQGVHIHGYSLPGAWVLSEDGLLRDGAGNPLTQQQVEQCQRGNPAEDLACLAELGAHFEVSYQPADRYWTFQWLEFGGYLVLAGALAGFTFWRIRRTG